MHSRILEKYWSRDIGLQLQTELLSSSLKVGATDFIFKSSGKNSFQLTD